MATWWRWAAFITTAGAFLTLAAVGGCGSSRKSSGTPAPAAGTSQLNFELQSLDVPADGAPSVTFRVTDAAGAPIDLLTEIANNAATPKTIPYISNEPRFTLAQLEDDGTYTNWYEGQVAPRDFTPPDGATPANITATQPIAQPTGSGVTIKTFLTPKGNGVYTFTFQRPPTTDAARLDRTKTLTVGVFGARVVNRENGGLKRYTGAATKNFVAGGGTPAAPHEAVSDAACNTCHVALTGHGIRRTVQLCKTCHAGDRGVTYQDPESGSSIDFRVMIHRIHNGVNLPSVLSNQPYYIVGFNQTVFDFSDARFPAIRDARECAVCHHGGADSDNWKNKASFTPCTACHDNVRFDGSAAGFCVLGTRETAPCNHVVSFPDPATTNCAGCHVAGSTIGPDVVHSNPVAVAAAPWKYEITGVTVGSDRLPHVQFRTLKNDQPLDIKSAPQWTASGGASRLFVDIGWPTIEYTNDGAGYVDTTVKTAQFPDGTPGQGLPVQIDALATATPVAGQLNVFEVVSPTPIPAGVTGATAVLEGHPAENGVRIPVANDVKQFDVAGGTPPARRQVVSADKCNACHESITAHGSNRNARPDVCIVCHTPRTTDFIRRVQAGDTGEEPIDFKVLVHEIHAADMRATRPVTIFGFGGSHNDFPASFPGKTGDCTICHVNSSYQLPFKDEVLDTTIKVGDPTKETDDPDEVRRPRTQAVCTACHDMVRFDSASRPLCNTLVPVNTPAAGQAPECNHSGGPQGNETNCAACHGAGALYDVAKVHAITVPSQ